MINLGRTQWPCRLHLLQSKVYAVSHITCELLNTKQLSSACHLALCRKWCRLGSDPKDAEEFVDQACKDGRIMPNAATVNNLNKLWDTHEQLHG